MCDGGDGHTPYDMIGHPCVQCWVQRLHWRSNSKGHQLYIPLLVHHTPLLQYREALLGLVVLTQTEAMLGLVVHHTPLLQYE